MSKYKIIIAVILLIAIAAAACAADEDIQPDDRNTVGGAETGEDTGEPENAAPERLRPNLGEADFEGYVFTYLTKTGTCPDWIDWIFRDCEAEEETGDAINDAVYRRNRYLEGKYNFTMVKAEDTDYQSDLRKAIGAGDDIYDVVFPNLDAAPGILFNKKLLAENQLEDPYDLVARNECTIDKLYEMCKGVMTYTDDRYGFIGQRDSMISFLHGAGELIATKDSDDIPVITFGSDRAYRAMDKTFDIMYDQNITHNAHHPEGRVPGIYNVSEQMFMEDRGGSG